MAVEEGVDAPGRLEQLAETAIRLGDRLDARPGAVTVRIVVVVGQGEEQEVEVPRADQLGGAAGRVAVSAAGDRGRLAGHLAARVEVAVEELGGSPGVVAELQPGGLDRASQQALQRDLVAPASAVDQEGRAGGAQAGVVELLEERLDTRVEVGEVHVVDEVVEGAEDPEGAARLERGAVLDVAPLEPVVPVHAADPVALGASTGDDLGARHRGHRGEAGDAVGDEHPALEQSAEVGRATLFDRALEHVGAQRVDVGEDQLLGGHCDHHGRWPAAAI